uniref:Uncharacterized protein n=1 Tax=Parascaris equorum TaxID=6256 RepID=A0A914R7F1_PAREQ
LNSKNYFSASITEKIGVSSLIGCFRQLRLSGKRVSLNKAKKTNKIAPKGEHYEVIQSCDVKSDHVLVD